MTFKYDANLMDIVKSSLDAFNVVDKPNFSNDEIYYFNEFLKDEYIDYEYRYPETDYEEKTIKKVIYREFKEIDSINSFIQIYQQINTAQTQITQLASLSSKTAQQEILQKELQYIINNIVDSDSFANKTTLMAIALRQARRLEAYQGRISYEDNLNGQCLKLIVSCQENSAIKRFLKRNGIRDDLLESLRSHLCCTDQLVFELNIAKQLKDLFPNKIIEKRFNDLNKEAEKYYIPLNDRLYGKSHSLDPETLKLVKHSNKILQILQSFPFEKTPLFRKILKILSAGYTEKWFIKQDAEKAEFKSLLKVLVAKQSIQTFPSAPSGANNQARTAPPPPQSPPPKRNSSLSNDTPSMPPPAQNVSRKKSGQFDSIVPDAPPLTVHSKENKAKPRSYNKYQVGAPNPNKPNKPKNSR